MIYIHLEVPLYYAQEIFNVCIKKEKEMRLFIQFSKVCFNIYVYINVINKDLKISEIFPDIMGHSLSLIAEMMLVVVFFLLNYICVG